METKQQTQAAKPQVPRGPAFCLRLNAFRALCCVSVILTHIVSFSGMIPQFRSLHFAGHQAVYYFFNLSGYLLSLSLVKEVKRRVFANNEKKASEDEEKGLVRSQSQSHSQSEQLEIESGQFNVYPASPAEKGVSGLKACFEQIKESTLVSILRKFLWNRFWKTFPMYFGAWIILQAFAHEGTHVETLNPHITWFEIFGLRVFPGHLWTMRLDLIFYFYVVPIYICVLYFAFKLKQLGFKMASKVAFAAIVATLLGFALYNMWTNGRILHPVTKKHYFFASFPPFCFGMLAGLTNFALEQRFNARQAANAQEPRDAITSEVQDDSFVGKVKAFVLRNKYSLIFTAVFLRIVALNPGMYTFFYPDVNENVPDFQATNWHSYWYGIFILINDTRGGFWKFMHPNEPKTTVLHPSFLHKVVYYFGLWSYAIYLTHPISYDLLKRVLPEKSQFTVEYYTMSVLIAFGLGVVVDYVFDKLFVDKFIMGKVFKKKDNKTQGKELQPAKASS